MSIEISEKERNKRLLLLLTKLMKEGDIDSFQLLETMVKNDTPSMQMSFKIIAENRLAWVSDFLQNNKNQKQ